MFKLFDFKRCNYLKLLYFLDDLSSISGSDTEREDTLDTFATAQGKIFLQNDKMVVFSLYKCLICDRKVSKTNYSVLIKMSYTTSLHLRKR